MTRKELRVLVESFGGLYREDERRTFGASWKDMTAIPPKDHVWACDDIHELVGGCYWGDAAWYADARDDFAERVRSGVRPCGDPDCEWCAGDYDELVREYTTR